MLTIDKNVPAPTKRPRQSYPFMDMRIGDSFVLRDPVEVKNARSAAWMFSQRHKAVGVRFSCRKVPEGWRMWRIA